MVLESLEEAIIMLAAIKGIIKGNTVIIENEDLHEYDGAEVVVTLLEYSNETEKKFRNGY